MGCECCLNKPKREIEIEPESIRIRSTPPPSNFRTVPSATNLNADNLITLVVGDSIA